MTEVFSDPERVAVRIQADRDLPFVSSARVIRKIPGRMVKFKLRFEPWLAMAAKGYPTEVVRVEVAPDCDLKVFPLSTKQRTWEHRYQANGHMAGGPLCLYFPDDPEAIRWSPEDGTFEEILGIISRHLQAEEYHRRHKKWPWEAAPHGPQAHYGPRSKLMRGLAKKGRE